MLVLKSNFNVWIGRFVMLVVLCTTNMSLADSRAYQHPLKDLRDNAKESIAALSSQPSVVVLIQPNCHWCKRQIDDLELLQSDCQGQFDTVLIGSKAKRNALKRELKHLSSSFPALQADAQFARNIGGVPATLITIFFDSEGNILARKQGYMPFETLRQAISIQTDKSC